jgi:hypothetical protein
LFQNANPESRFYSFDTFTELPEDFGVYKKGTFNNNTEAPRWMIKEQILSKLISANSSRFFEGVE